MRKSILIFLCVTSISCMTLGPDRILYNKALQDAREDNSGASLFTLRQLLREYPDSPFAADAKFALGEYYFGQNVFHDSFSLLLEFLENYPEHPARLFALAMVYKIIQRQAQENIDGKLREKFFKQPLFLLFSKSRIKQYRSLLNTRFTIREYIDKIEILKNDETFLVVYP